MIALRNGSPLHGIAPRVPPTPADLRVSSHGDSMTRDSGRFNYLYQLRSLILSGQSLNAKVTQRGINGISFDYAWEGEPYEAILIEDAIVSVDLWQNPSIPDWLIVWAGSNGMALGLHSAATEYANFKTYVAARISAGREADKIVVLPMLPRSGFPYGTVQAYNSLLVGDDEELGYRLAPIHEDPYIGAEGAEADPEFYYDGTHIIHAGHAIVGGILYDTMFP
jgi:hypothetical protein